MTRAAASSADGTPSAALPNTGPQPPRSDTVDRPKVSTGWVVLALILLLGSQPMSTDLYQSSLPSLPKVFGVSIATVQLTLSALIFAFGCGQLVLGPVADRYGRRPVLVAGLSLYFLASVLAVLSPHIAWLIACRAAQGIGMAACVVCARSIIRDLFEPHEGARVIASAMMWMSFIPLLGPILGGFLETQVGWRGAFAVLALFGAATLLVILNRLPETIRAKNPHATRLDLLWRNWAEIARHPAFLAYTAVTAFTYAGLFSFITGASFVLVDVLGLTRQGYGFAFAFMVCGYLVGTVWCRRLLSQRGLVRSLRVAAFVSLLGGGSMAVLALAGVHHPLAILLPQFVFMVAHGIHQPCGQAGTVGPFPTRAGAAAALSGFLMMVLAFLVGGWIGKSFNGTVYPLTLTIGFWSAMTAFAALVLVKRYGEPHKA